MTSTSPYATLLVNEISGSVEAQELYCTTHQAPQFLMPQLMKKEKQKPRGVLTLGNLRVALTCIMGIGRMDGGWLCSICSQGFGHSTVGGHIGGMSLQFIKHR